MRSAHARYIAMVTSPDLSSTARATARLRVVLTRPADRQIELAQRLRSLRFEVLQLPALTIRPVLPIEQGLDSQTALANWQPARFDAIVFVSRTAWQSYWQNYWQHHHWQHAEPAAILPTLACVGIATARQIAHDLQAPLAQITYPDGRLSSDSEGLWQLLKVRLKKNARVLIVRGQNGRDWLADTLVTHGMHVSCLSVYQRQANTWTEVDVQALLAWSEPTMSGLRDTGIWLVTSAEGMQAIAGQYEVQGLTGRPGLQPQAVVVVHERLVEPVRQWLANWQLDHCPVVVSDPDDEAIVRAVLQLGSEAP